MTTFPTSGPVRARIDIEWGDIRVLTGSAAEAVVEVLPTDPSNEKDVRAAEGTRATLTDGRLDVVGPKRSALVGPTRKSGSVQVHVSLPEDSALEARASLGRVVTEGALREVSAKTGAGDVHVQAATVVDLKTGLGDITAGDVAGDCRLSTGSGAVRVERADGQVLVKNSNGDTWIGAAGPSTRVKVANGDIVVERAPGDVMATTANGSVRVASAEQGQVMLRTSMGRIEIGIPEGTAARLDLRTTYGAVRNALEAADGPSAGERTVEVSALTSAGDIDVVRALAIEA